ncbi:ATP-binding cassette domain-containing protein [Sinorhizobium meliloti]|nr:ATP-binding cassette domain-containing protein [Sinorhizobium meliloti]
MSSEPAISVKDVSKTFPLTRGPAKLAARLRGRKTDVTVLRNVSFSVAKGESVGVVGVNGSGKSTILQIIAGTMSPTSGRVEINGRVAAILELGAGFNPEFSGRENALLGLKLMGTPQREALQAVEEVREFSGLGEHFEYPIKTYSSGMYVRLAFSVAVAGVPDILIVDEALAVGDAAFQRKCYEKLAAVKARGGTLLFVSHDEEAVRTLTDRAVLLHKGDMLAVGPSDDIAFRHRSMALMEGQPIRISGKTFGDGSVSDLTTTLVDADGISRNAFRSGELVKLRVAFTAECALSKLNVGFRIRSSQGFKVYSGGTLNGDIATGDVYSGFWSRAFERGRRIEVEFEFEGRLGAGKYEIQAVVSREATPDYRTQEVLAWRDDAAVLEVHHSAARFGGCFDLKPRFKVMEDRV